MELFEHFIQNQLSPELQLMRWLRCMLSREFDPSITLMLWDYILGGVYIHFTKDYQEELAKP